MRLSSIFSSETYQARRGSLFWLALLVVMLLVGEFLLRMPPVLSALPRPEPTLWHAPLIQTKLDYLKEFEENQGIDVLFIGNSSVQSAVNPAVFDSVRLRTETPRPGSFNGAVEGLPPYGVLLFLEIYLRYTRPSAIIYGITPQDINSASPWAKEVTERIQQSTMVWAESERGLKGWTSARLLRMSNLYRYRYLLHQLLLRGGVVQSKVSVYFDKRGFHPIPKRLSDFNQSERVRLRSRAGVLNYSPQGAQLQELTRLIELCSRKEIRLILVNMPLADEYYRNFDRPEDYGTYLRVVRELASQHRIPLWDMERLPGDQNLADKDFADLNHLNRSGAAKFSEMVGIRYRSSDEFRFASR